MEEIVSTRRGIAALISALRKRPDLRRE